MSKFGMVIDLNQCVGCGTCAIACKAENNTRNRDNGQSFNWADFLIETKGTFPNTTYVSMPVLCNHCTNAPCVTNCPTGAMFKTPEGITMHDNEKCIGCQMCQKSCPYSQETLDDNSLEGSTYSVISFNAHNKDTQPQWKDTTEIIPSCTASGAETAKAAGAVIPMQNKFIEGDVKNISRPGIVEKCTFCYHRTSNGMKPACVEVCPSKARIFGDQENKNSEIAQILSKQPSFRLQEDKGTLPNVHYIGKYCTRG